MTGISDNINRQVKTTDAVTKLAQDHWGYVESLLKAHDVDNVLVEVAGFHYISAFIHGYKHAKEECDD